MSRVQMSHIHQCDDECVSAGQIINMLQSLHLRSEQTSSMAQIICLALASQHFLQVQILLLAQRISYFEILVLVLKGLVHCIWSLGHYDLYLSRLSSPLYCITSPTVLASPGNTASSHLISSRLMMNMSLKTQQVEDLRKASSGKHSFNSESPFIFHYILRHKSSVVFILLMYLLQVFYHQNSFVRNYVVNQACKWELILWAVILIKHFCKFLNM